MTNDATRAARRSRRRATEASRRARGLEERRVASDEFFSSSQRELFTRGRRTTRPRGQKTKTFFYAERRASGAWVGKGRRAEGTIEAEVGFPVGGEPPVVRGVVGSNATSVAHCDDVALANGLGIEGGKGKTRCAVKLVYQRARSPTTIIVGEHRSFFAPSGANVF